MIAIKDMEEMPSCCRHCPCSDDSQCNLTTQYNDLKGRPDDCPLVEIVTCKDLGEELRTVREGITDEKVLIGFNMAIAICNKYLGESEK